MVKHAQRFKRKLRSVNANTEFKLRNVTVNGHSPFTKPPLKVVEVRLKVADEQGRIAGRGYVYRVIRVEG